MKKLRILLTICTLALLLLAARPLICWRIGLDLQWHRARCYSTEFDALAPGEQPAPYTPAPTATLEPAPTWTWEPLPYQSPTPTLTATAEPYPALPTETEMAYPWSVP